ncbi:hypothetical protein SAMN05446935_1104 [Burkholderia sp. YR290]|jgi:hypothetical protein|uniref:Uncharacterized protein n=1 Tax=Paraburkholderia hospita TaxID=169430 RepID=A0ABN0FNX5_9BURK|nr:hypothetical protein WQE_13616 [Paraburkholderia hospita]EUC17048.1 hypothetical protein PMI06_004569 [Burkholderia sp. BT03]SKC69671.1 hypothetical protein SAMN05445504_0962 [Burkholderia sp. CF099]SOE56840.1 hypothetical protein SAMN05446935_1104 [Burkholderia sp. YR290]OUL68037.1 hypothetical protein CA603_53070 [Paraburkholderia hospita]
MHASIRRRAARNGRDATRAPLQSVETRCPNEGRAIAARLVNNEATDTLRGFRISEPTLRRPEDARRTMTTTRACQGCRADGSARRLIGACANVPAAERIT